MAANVFVDQGGKATSAGICEYDSRWLCAWDRNWTDNTFAVLWYDRIDNKVYYQDQTKLQWVADAAKLFGAAKIDLGSAMAQNVQLQAPGSSQPPYNIPVSESSKNQFTIGDKDALMLRAGAADSPSKFATSIAWIPQSSIIRANGIQQIPASSVDDAAIRVVKLSALKQRPAYAVPV